MSRLGKFLAFPAVFISLAVISGPWAHAATYNIDKDHSTVAFSIRHLVTKVHGLFDDFSGQINYDEKNPSKGSVTTDIKTASVNTHVEKRDNDLRSSNFFDSSKYPDMTFKSTKVKGKGKKMKVDGILSLHGVEKPVTLEVEFLGISKDPWGNTRAGFSGTTHINRKDFGLTWNKTLESGGVLVGDDVDITLDVEAIQAKADTKAGAKSPAK